MDSIEDLSNENIISLAQKLGLTLGKEFKRELVISQILETISLEMEDESNDYLAGDILNRKFSLVRHDHDQALAPAAPPSISYNKTGIWLVRRDPHWALAFWEMSDSEKAKIVNSGERYRFFLRVIQCTDQTSSTLFDIAIGPNDSRWYINFPSEFTRYEVALCAQVGKSSFVITRSKKTSTSRLRLPQKLDAYPPEQAAILRLAGIELLNIEARTGAQ